MDILRRMIDAQHTARIARLTAEIERCNKIPKLGEHNAKQTR